MKNFRSLLILLVLFFGVHFSNATISTETNRNDYVGTGVVDVYQYNFKIFDEGDLLVTTKDTTGTESTLVLNVDYTVDGAGDDAGGEVTLLDGPLTADYGITIRRVLEIEQPTDIRNQGAFFPSIHEDAFDRLTMLVQQLQDQVNRSLKLAETDYLSSFFLPTEVDRANRYLAFDADGNPIAATELGDGLTVSAYMESFLASTNASNARIALGINGSSQVIATGDIADLGITTGKLAGSAVTNAKFRDSAGLSLVGRATNSTGAVADITAANDYEVVQRIGSTLAFGSYKLKVRSVTTTDSPTTADDVLNLSGASFTVTIPTAVGNTGKVLTLNHQGSNLSQIYTLNSTSGQTIGGLASGVYKLATNGEKLEIYSDGTNWLIKNHDANTDWIDSGEGLASYYTYTISSGSATLGATYTNNGNTYTVAKTVAAGLSVVMQGPAAPAASGTLTKSGGTGDATLTFSAVSGSAYRIGGTTTAPTLYGTPTVNQMIWRRSGKFVTVRARFHQTSAGVVGSGDYIWPTPLNITIDTTYYSTFTGGTVQAIQSQTAASGVALQHSISGRVTNESSPAQAFVTDWAPYTSTSYRVYLLYVNGDSAYPIGSTYEAANIAILSYNWEVTFPVSGWQP